MSDKEYNEKMRALYQECLSGLILQETLEKERDFIHLLKKPSKSTDTDKRLK